MINLKSYMDMIRYELKDENIPTEYLKIKINEMRREIAYKTRCMECYSECLAESCVYKYRFPRSSTDTSFVDLIEVLTLEYDGVILEYIDPQEMHLLHETVSSGTPAYYTVIGGKSQPFGWIEVYPTPSESGKTIWIHGIQYPLPLVDPLPNSVVYCELQDAIQRIVVNQIVGELMLKAWRTPGISLLNLNREEIRDHTKLRKW